MKRLLVLLFFILILLAGCASLPYYYELGKEGYSSPEGTATRTAVETAAKPFVGEPWATILASLIGILTGGYAVHKRRQWLDTPSEKRSG